MDLREKNKSILWAYKTKLIGFTSNRKKREKKIQKEIKRGVREVNTQDPFELFLTLHNIRYVYYKETEKILGNTYGMVSSELSPPTRVVGLTVF
jgi:N-acetyltransferase 10